MTDGKCRIAGCKDNANGGAIMFANDGLELTAPLCCIHLKMIRSSNDLRGLSFDSDHSTPAQEARRG